MARAETRPRSATQPKKTRPGNYLIEGKNSTNSIGQSNDGHEIATDILLHSLLASKVLEEDEGDVEAHHAEEVRHAEKNHHWLLEQLEIYHLRESRSKGQWKAFELPKNFALAFVVNVLS